MTIELCKASLLNALSDQGNRVVALTGKWGSGKTHLWRDIQDNAADDLVKAAALVSLFGVGSVRDLKIKIAQALLPKVKGDKVLGRRIEEALGGVRKLLKSIHPGFGALDDMAQLVVPSLLKNKLIVIDDIERKHDELSIDEVLGFIDDCVNSLGCRVLLILNDDKLKDRELWDQFREKVIDQEFNLETSPREAFAISQQIVKTKWVAELEAAIVACDITNIRIICKIIRITNQLLAAHDELSVVVLNRVIPPIVLLSAIFYKSFSNGPTFEYVLNYKSEKAALNRFWKQQYGPGDDDDDDDEENKLYAQWDSLLDALGFQYSGDFESLLVSFLKSGLFDGQSVRDLIEKYKEDERRVSVMDDVHDFIHEYNWCPEVSTADLVSRLRGFQSGVQYIEVSTLSFLIDVSERLTGDVELGKTLIAAWSDWINRCFPNGLKYEEVPPRRALRSELQEVLETLYSRYGSTMTVVQACYNIRARSGWGREECYLLKSVDVAKYESQIRCASGRDLEVLISQGVKFVLNKSSYEESFGDVGGRFAEACRNIVKGESGSRLQLIISRYFESKGVEDALK
ncbi:TPA: AAA family ATPase [Pseudomonas aeruginosa]